MDWKLGYGSVGLIALILSAGLIWVELESAPLEIPASVSLHEAPVLNPYPELKGLVVRINTASLKQLQQLPGIGEAKAKAIRDYVRDYGRITTFSQILEVEGIGETILRDIKPFISLS